MRSAVKPFTLALTITTSIFTLLVAVGCLRYGGAEGLLQRVEVEFAQLESQVAITPTLTLPTIAKTNDSNLAVSATTVQAEDTLSNTVVLLPTITPEPAITATQQVLSLPTLSLLQPTSASVELSGLRHEWQTWNNCGPATLSFYLSYYGSQLSQTDTGTQLRHHPDDKNVSPEELAAYAQSLGYLATVRLNGSQELMRTFLSHGIPVLIETWLEEEPNDGMGHYRLLTGYDDAGQYWIAYDSYVSQNLLNPDGVYRGIRLNYPETDALWKVFNRTYLVIYPPEKQDLVSAIFGEALSDPMKSDVAALEQAQREIAAKPADAFAWFNLGSMLLSFNDPQEAANAFDEARRLGLPWRMLWYQYGPFAAYSQVGRYQEVIELADATLRNVNSIEELYYWKGVALAGLGDTLSAKQLWEIALSLNANFVPAQQALNDTSQ